MSDTSAHRVEKITLDQVPAILDQAAAEAWTELTIWGAGVPFDPPAGPHSYKLEDENLTIALIERLASLTALTSLSLVGNNIGDDGAQALGGLTALTSLRLNDNNIGDGGARALGGLTALTSLSLDHNNIGDGGAQALGGLTALTTLWLNDNNIGDDGVRALGGLTALTTLWLNNNNIGDRGAQALLEAWNNAANAWEKYLLDFGQNPRIGTVLPADLFDTPDAQAILAAYRRFREEGAGLAPSNEARMLVVGDEAAGKTSLIRYLVDGTPRDEDERKTDSIDVSRRIRTEDWTPADDGVHLNIWDFGGQVVMRGAHRYFLSARCLYILVLDGRKEDDAARVEEWLRTIASLGRDSPVIVVINKCDEGTTVQRRDDVAGTRAAYPAIVADHLRVACNDDDPSRDSIAGLRALIAETLATHPGLAHIRDGIPPSWRRVKDQVRVLARDNATLTHARFIKLCLDGEKPVDRIENEDEQRALLVLLHQLGVVVAHGLDIEGDPGEGHERAGASVSRFGPTITLLDPNWLTEAIYPVLEGTRANDPQGEFTAGDLSKWLPQERYPPERHGFIIDRMLDPDIGLAARLPPEAGSGEAAPARYLVPNALPGAAPEYEDIWPEDSLRFRMRYKLLPSHLFPHFIVEAHRHLTENRTRWFTGAVLRVEGRMVLLTADRGGQRIDIKVAGEGPSRRVTLGIVRDLLRAVHDRYPECEPTECVPLTDQPELDVSYDDLLTMEREDGGPGHEFRPQGGASRRYTVGELLDGVRHEPSHRSRRDRDKLRLQAMEHRPPPPAPPPSPSHVAEPAPTNPSPPVQAAPPPREASWRPFALRCGLAAMAWAAGLWLFISPEYWPPLIVVTAIGIGVAAIVWSRNPSNFYRGLMTPVIFAGLASANGKTLNALVEAGGASGVIQFGADPNIPFLVFCGFALFLLAILEAYRLRQDKLS